MTSVARSGAGVAAGRRALLPIIDRRLAAEGHQDSCYFRSGPPPGERKALIQITQRCDLQCVHCFVSATHLGRDMSAAELSPAVVARLVEARVATVTLTGGEPFVHPELVRIAATMVRSDIDVTICTNAVNVSPAAIDELGELSRVRINVSLDGASNESHGRFRGDRGSFDRTTANTRAIASAGLLKGVLCTPNALATADEYRQIYELAAELGADYMLLNPLSSYGRGIKSQSRLRAADATMAEIEKQINASVAKRDGTTEAVYTRFPRQAEPLSGCIAGDLFYVFVNGQVTVCPYLVFATQNPGARHKAEEFMVGNLFEHQDLAHRLDDYRFAERYQQGANGTCRSCQLNGSCGKGCPAAVIAAGGRIGDLDAEVCPTAPEAGAAACS